MIKYFLLLFFLTAFFLAPLITAEVRINELELNPLNEDSGNEWIELYSSNEVNLTDWTISSEGKNMTFNASFSGYFSINTTGSLLVNEGNSFFLRDSAGNIVSSTGVLADTNNDARSWQYCSGNWLFRASTRNQENNCTEPPDSEEIGNSSSKAGISLEIEWKAEEIINGNEFEIKVRAFNLEEKDYALKIWIQPEDSSEIISDRYDSNEKKWASGNYWIYGFFSGPGNQTQTARLRIRPGHEDFYGDAQIFFKIKNTSEIGSNRNIKILEAEVNESSGNSEESSYTLASSSEELPQENENILILGGKKPETSESKDIKNQENVIYKSKSEYIKEYAPYAFGLLCVILLIIILIDWKSAKKQAKKHGKNKIYLHF